MRIFKFLKKRKLFKKSSFSNSVTLYLSGYNLERQLNSLCKKVDILSVEKINQKHSKIEIEVAKERTVEQFFKKKNIDVLKKEYNGLAKFQKFFFSRYGILIGIFFAICGYVVMSNYVLKVEIMGNESLSRHDITSVLNENNIGIFDPLSLKTNEEIEKIIMENFDEISMVSVIKKGNTILINIKEKLLNDDHERTSYIPLIATDDGLITEIELVQGTLLVKVGDMVRAGDYLVAPYVIDSSGKKIPIEPKANICANVWLSGQSYHYDVKKITERTGEKVSERVVSFLDQTVYVNDFEIPFSEYEAEITEVYLSESVLPIKYKLITYFETNTFFLEQDFWEVESQKIQEAKDLARVRINLGEEIMSENFVITSNQGKTTVNYSITVNRKIS